MANSKSNAQVGTDQMVFDPAANSNYCHGNSIPKKSKNASSRRNIKIREALEFPSKLDI